VCIEFSWHSVWSGERSSEPLGSINDEEFIDLLSCYQLLVKELLGTSPLYACPARRKT
jgi:hypothetical protein